MIRLRTACVAGLLACALAAPQPAAALDLEGALREVAAANPTLEARREMVVAAEHRVARAGAWQSPMLELGVVDVPTTGSFDTDPMTMKMIGITQRLPLFGANGLARRSVPHDRRGPLIGDADGVDGTSGCQRGVRAFERGLGHGCRVEFHEAGSR